MFGCCFKKKVELKLEPPRYVEPRASAVELVKYEKIIGELSDTSCEPVVPTPPPRDRDRERERISFLVNDKEDNSIKSSEDESLFNISVNHSILSEKFGNGSFKSGNVRILSGKDDELRDNEMRDKEIEPIITVNISIKNERNGVLIHRKIYL